MNVLTIWNVENNGEFENIIWYRVEKPFNVEKIKIGSSNPRKIGIPIRYMKHLEYKIFKKENFFFLQMIMRLLYLNRWNKMKWAPSNLAGMYTKNLLYDFINHYTKNLKEI